MSARVKPGGVGRSQAIVIMGKRCSVKKALPFSKKRFEGGLIGVIKKENVLSMGLASEGTFLG